MNRIRLTQLPLSWPFSLTNNLTSKVDAKGTTHYTYDELNRIETITEPCGKVIAYTYSGGNITVKEEVYGTVTVRTEYTIDENNRCMQVVITRQDTLQSNDYITQAVYAYVYDANGNQTQETATPYIDGIEQQSYVSGAYTYDAFNQMIQAVTTDSQSNSGTVVNAYNGDGLRVSKTVNGDTTYYLLENENIVLEVDSQGNELARNVYGTNLIFRTVDNDTLYYMYNGHGDVTVLTDFLGTIVATYYYDAYGAITEMTGSADNSIAFAGYIYDKETGLYYLNARMYNPITARFLQEDTYNGKSTDVLSLNLYAYCTGNPIKYIDPSGHMGIIQALDWVLGIMNSALNSAQGNWDNFKASINTGVEELRSSAGSTYDSLLESLHDGWFKADDYLNNVSHVMANSAIPQVCKEIRESSWQTKVVLGTGVIVGLGAVAIATGGVGLAGAVAFGAFKGAAFGAVSGVASGAVAGAAEHWIKTGSLEGAKETVLNSAADGYMIGAVTGAVTGAYTGFNSYATNPANALRNVQRSYTSSATNLSDDSIRYSQATRSYSKSTSTSVTRTNATSLIDDTADDVGRVVGEGGSQAGKPNQVHHYATDKSKTYTNRFEDITKKYDLGLNGEWNKELLPHQGRHPNAYHDFILDEMRKIDNIAKGNRDVFLDLYETEVKSIIRDNPNMLYSEYWKNLK